MTVATETSLDPRDAQLAADIGAVYPGITAERYAVNWSRYLCDDIANGLAGEALTQRAIDRFAGGSRPDPTPEQAQQIIAIVQGYC